MKPIKHVVKTTPLAFYTFFVKVYLLSFFFFVKTKQSLGVQGWRFVYHTKRRKIICDWPLFFSIYLFKGLLLSIIKQCSNDSNIVYQLFSCCSCCHLAVISQYTGLTGSFTLQLKKKSYKAFNWQKLKSIQLIKVDIVTAGTKVGKFVNVISAPRACNAPCSACPALIFQIPAIFKIFQTPVIFLVWWAEKQYQRPKTKVSCFNLSNTNDFFDFWSRKQDQRVCCFDLSNMSDFFIFYK